jgi:hypothetical protein
VDLSAIEVELGFGSRGGFLGSVVTRGGFVCLFFWRGNR